MRAKRPFEQVSRGGIQHRQGWDERRRLQLARVPCVGIKPILDRLRDIDIDADLGDARERVTPHHQQVEDHDGQTE